MRNKCTSALCKAAINALIKIKLEITITSC